MRTIISVENNDIELLDNICANEHMTRTSAIRQAIKDYIVKKSHKKTKAFGAFKDIFGNEDSVNIQRKLRQEYRNLSC